MAAASSAGRTRSHALQCAIIREQRYRRRRHVLLWAAALQKQSGEDSAKREREVVSADAEELSSSLEKTAALLQQVARFGGALPGPVGAI